MSSSSVVFEVPEDAKTGGVDELSEKFEPALQNETSTPKKSLSSKKSVEFARDVEDAEKVLTTELCPPTPSSGTDTKDVFAVESRFQYFLKRTDVILQYHVVPPVFLVFFTISVQLLASFGRNEFPSPDLILPRLYGNPTSWFLVFCLICWAILWLLIPSQKTFGPQTPFGFIPEYKNNGIGYYIATMVVYGGLHIYWPGLSSTIFWNMPWILAALNIIAFLLCIVLFIRGLRKPDHESEIDGLPSLYLFFRGVTIHPRIAGIDIKQLTNCRIGLMSWQLLITAFYITGFQRYGYNAGSFVNFILQTVYLVKFFWWESGYFWTLDIAYDHAGYYICWGCLVFVPALYTYSSYYLVLHEPTIYEPFAMFLVIVGLSAIMINYRVDYEKHAFQKHRYDGRLTLWGKTVTYIPAIYTDVYGVIHRTKLLVSGCWGVARHLNYTFELLLALAWSAPGYQFGLHTFLYFIFLLVLLIHRCFRDEKKCREKYEQAYEEYCTRVPYRMIPYIF